MKGKRKHKIVSIVDRLCKCKWSSPGSRQHRPSKRRRACVQTPVLSATCLSRRSTPWTSPPTPALECALPDEGTHCQAHRGSLLLVAPRTRPAMCERGDRGWWPRAPKPTLCKLGSAPSRLKVWAVELLRVSAHPGLTHVLIALLHLSLSLGRELGSPCAAPRTLGSKGTTCAPKAQTNQRDSGTV
jgi:hypothetical protein